MDPNHITTSENVVIKTEDACCRCCCKDADQETTAEHVGGDGKDTCHNTGEMKETRRSCGIDTVSCNVVAIEDKTSKPGCPPPAHQHGHHTRGINTEKQLWDVSMPGYQYTPWNRTSHHVSSVPLSRERHIQTVITPMRITSPSIHATQVQTPHNEPCHRYQDLRANYPHSNNGPSTLEQHNVTYGDTTYMQQEPLCLSTRCRGIHNYSLSNIQDKPLCLSTKSSPEDRYAVSANHQDVLLDLRVHKGISSNLCSAPEIVNSPVVLELPLRETHDDTSDETHGIVRTSGEAHPYDNDHNLGDASRETVVTQPLLQTETAQSFNEITITPPPGECSTTQIQVDRCPLSENTGHGMGIDHNQAEHDDILHQEQSNHNDTIHEDAADHADKVRFNHDSNNAIACQFPTRSNVEVCSSPLSIPNHDISQVLECEETNTNTSSSIQTQGNVDNVRDMYTDTEASCQGIASNIVARVDEPITIDSVIKLEIEELEAFGLDADTEIEALELEEKFALNIRMWNPEECFNISSPSNNRADQQSKLVDSDLIPGDVNIDTDSVNHNTATQDYEATHTNREVTPEIQEDDSEGIKICDGTTIETSEEVQAQGPKVLISSESIQNDTLIANAIYEQSMTESTQDARSTIHTIHDITTECIQNIAITNVIQDLDDPTTINMTQEVTLNSIEVENSVVNRANCQVAPTILEYIPIHKEATRLAQCQGDENMVALNEPVTIESGIRDSPLDEDRISNTYNGNVNSNSITYVNQNTTDKRDIEGDQHIDFNESSDAAGGSDSSHMRSKTGEDVGTIQMIYSDISSADSSDTYVFDNQLENNETSRGQSDMCEPNGPNLAFVEGNLIKTTSGDESSEDTSSRCISMQMIHSMCETSRSESNTHMRHDGEVIQSDMTMDIDKNQSTKATLDGSDQAGESITSRVMATIGEQSEPVQEVCYDVPDINILANNVGTISALNSACDDDVVSLSTVQSAYNEDCANITYLAADEHVALNSVSMNVSIAGFKVTEPIKLRIEPDNSNVETIQYMSQDAFESRETCQPIVAAHAVRSPTYDVTNVGSINYTGAVLMTNPVICEAPCMPGVISGEEQIESESQEEIAMIVLKCDSDRTLITCTSEKGSQLSKVKSESKCAAKCESKDNIFPKIEPKCESSDASPCQPKYNTYEQSVKIEPKSETATPKCEPFDHYSTINIKFEPTETMQNREPTFEPSDPASQHGGIIMENVHINAVHIQGNEQLSGSNITDHHIEQMSKFEKHGATCKVPPNLHKDSEHLKRTDGPMTCITRHDNVNEQSMHTDNMGYTLDSDQLSPNKYIYSPHTTDGGPFKCYHIGCNLTSPNRREKWKHLASHLHSTTNKNTLTSKNKIKRISYQSWKYRLAQHSKNVLNITKRVHRSKRIAREHSLSEPSTSIMTFDREGFSYASNSECDENDLPILKNDALSRHNFFERILNSLSSTKVSDIITSVCRIEHELVQTAVEKPSVDATHTQILNENGPTNSTRILKRLVDEHEACIDDNTVDDMSCSGLSDQNDVVCEEEEGHVVRLQQPEFYHDSSLPKDIELSEDTDTEYLLKSTCSTPEYIDENDTSELQHDYHQKDKDPRQYKSPDRCDERGNHKRNYPCYDHTIPWLSQPGHTHKKSSPSTHARHEEDDHKQSYSETPTRLYQPHPRRYDSKACHEESLPIKHGHISDRQTEQNGWRNERRFQYGPNPDR